MSEQRNVVIAMDESEYSAYAFDWYMKNGHRPEDHVIMVHCPEYHAIIQSPLSGDLAMAARQWAEENDRVKRLISLLGDRLKAAGIGGKVKSVTGVPGEVIVRVADEEKASFIVTGCRGQGKFRRTLLGSVSDYILHHSHVPVVVCRHKDDLKHHHHHN